MLRIIMLVSLLLGATVASAQTPDDPPPPAGVPESDPPLEFVDPDALLTEFAAQIREKRMDDLFKALVRTANLTHPVKNFDPEALRRIGTNLLGLFLDRETVHYVDRVRDERHGTSLREVVFLAYTSRDRWIYFTFVLKRGATGWQVTRFDYAIDRFDVFPDGPAD